MARVSGPAKRVQPKRASGPSKGYVPPVRENVRVAGSGTPIKAQTPAQVRAQQRSAATPQLMAQYGPKVQPYQVPGRGSTPYQPAYNPNQAAADKYRSQYGPKPATTVAGVRQFDAPAMTAYKAANTPSRAQTASANRYAAQANAQRWEPDYAAAKYYMGYGSGPGYGQKPGSWSEESQWATADRYTGLANRYYKPPSGGGGGGWGSYPRGGGGGGGGGGYTERPPEWYEQMAQWSYGKG